MLNAIVLLQIFLVSLTNGQTSPPSTLYTFPAPTTTAPPPIETTPTIAPSPTATPVTTVSPPIATTAPVHEVCFKCWNATCHNKDHQNKGKKCCKNWYTVCKNIHDGTVDAELNSDDDFKEVKKCVMIKKKSKSNSKSSDKSHKNNGGHKNGGPKKGNLGEKNHKNEGDSHQNH